MFWTIISTALKQWRRHRCSQMGAALAYYSVFSLGPVLLITISIAGLLYGREEVRGHLTRQLSNMLGDAGGQAVEMALTGASAQSSAHATAWYGVVFLGIASIGIFAHLKNSMNTIWDVEKPAGRHGIIWLVRTYLVSAAAVMSLGFLLLVSLVLTAGLSAMSHQLDLVIAGPPLALMNAAFSLVVLTFLFAMIFKWLPDAAVSWKDVWMGAAITAILFEIGKFAIGWYVGTRGLESTYGAAGSLLVLLVWVYYSAQIFLFGAELTRAFARHREHQKNHRFSISAMLSFFRKA